jgi:hypothetical protein
VLDKAERGKSVYADTRPNPIIQERRIESARITDGHLLELKFDDDVQPSTVVIPLVGQNVTVHLMDLDRSASYVAKHLPTLE